MEKYELNFVGKQKAKEISKIPTDKKLVLDNNVSTNLTSDNMIIVGDNLDALKLLKQNYENKIKMIYIDPPYNTGNNFIYNDKFYNNKNDKHSNWLSFMCSRLLLARDLLSDDGVIFISIDDNEQANLKLLCDEIFGEENFVSMISVKVRDSAGESGGGEDKKLKKNVEYLLIYTKNKEIFELPKLYIKKQLKNEIIIKEVNNSSYGYKEVLLDMKGRKFEKSINDGYGNEIKLYTYDTIVKKTVSFLAKEEKTTVYDIYKKYYQNIFTTYNARTSIRDRVIEALPNYEGLIEIEYIPKSGKYKNNLIKKYFFGKTKRLLSWLSEISELNKENEILIKEELGTLWQDISWGTLANEGEVPFDNGKKPISFIKRQIMLANVLDFDIVLDFFAGSGTTGQAVMELNAEDGGNRKFILVQIDEPIKEDKPAYKFCVENNLPPVISSLTIERVKRAGEKIKQEIEKQNNTKDLFVTEKKQIPDIGFKVFKIV